VCSLRCRLVARCHHTPVIEHGNPHLAYHLAGCGDHRRRHLLYCSGLLGKATAAGLSSVCPAPSLLISCLACSPNLTYCMITKFPSSYTLQITAATPPTLLRGFLVTWRPVCSPTYKFSTSSSPVVGCDDQRRCQLHC
jgi:hypothetical protein